MQTEGSNWPGRTSLEIINPVWVFLARLKEKARIRILELSWLQESLWNGSRRVGESLEQVERWVELGWAALHSGCAPFLLDALPPLLCRPSFAIFALESLKAGFKSRDFLFIFEPRWGIPGLNSLCLLYSSFPSDFVVLPLSSSKMVRISFHAPWTWAWLWDLFGSLIF